jgi:hypothetical protein
MRSAETRGANDHGHIYSTNPGFNVTGGDNNPAKPLLRLL